jgi:hypothetical protein
MSLASSAMSVPVAIAIPNLRTHRHPVGWKKADGMHDELIDLMYTYTR